MPETLTVHREGAPAKWTWFNVQNDLATQGELIRGDGTSAVTVDPLSMGPFGCGGEFKGNRFAITWIKDAFLLLSMAEHSDELVEGFARVVGYRPFCKYIDVNGLPTVEWDKIDPEGRFKELHTEGKTDLQRVPAPPLTQSS